MDGQEVEDSTYAVGTLDTCHSVICMLRKPYGMASLCGRAGARRPSLGEPGPLKLRLRRAGVGFPGPSYGPPNGYRGFGPASASGEGCRIILMAVLGRNNGLHNF